MRIDLYSYQEEALGRMKDGCILCGGVGSGKSRTGLAYYYTQYGGQVNVSDYVPMQNPPDLYIITTARKRDTNEWEAEMAPFLLSSTPECDLYSHKVVVDSWNNVQKYKDVEGAFFIFDEQRVVGKGVWVKSFLKIAKANRWILLSATPGDTWSDYIPVFIANGFYKNRRDFERQHIIWARYAKFPKIDRYLNVGRLIRLRRSVLVNMNFERKTISHHEKVIVQYDQVAYQTLWRTRWNPWTQEPYQNASDLCYGLRKLVNTDPSRLEALNDILEHHPKAIVFYNFDYELDLIKQKYEPMKDVEVAEWNGHKHQPLPEGERWIYLVQYTAGAEGWNCITTDTIIFYSQNYSYKVMVQSAGRIDRLNTPFTDLYFYHLRCKAAIDASIAEALNKKKKFNELKFLGGSFNGKDNQTRNSGSADAL